MDCARQAVYAPEGLKDYAAPTSAADLRDLLAQSIVEIRMGKLDPKLANSISYLGAGFLRALELADLEAHSQPGCLRLKTFLAAVESGYGYAISLPPVV